MRGEVSWADYQEFAKCSRNVHLGVVPGLPEAARVARAFRANLRTMSSLATARPELPGQEGRTVEDLLDEAPTSRFHRRTVIISGVGFFTDAYDLFVIGTAAALVATQWHLSTTQTSWVTGAAILGAFVGAFTFGRIADVIGRKKVYVTVAVIMIFGALASALAPELHLLGDRSTRSRPGDRRRLSGLRRVHERVLEPT